MRHFRCPYCKTDLGDQLAHKCPGCGKTMRVPGPLLPPRPRQPKRIHKGREGRLREARAAVVNNMLTAKRGSHLFIVLIGMVLVGGTLVGRLGQKQEQARATRDLDAIAQRELSALRAALELFHYDVGRYPSAAEGLDALVTPIIDRKWRGNYISLLKPDPWIHEYVYLPGTNGPTLLSAGPDGAPGTSDDLYPDDWEPGFEAVKDLPDRGYKRIWK